MKGYCCIVEDWLRVITYYFGNKSSLISFPTKVLKFCCVNILYTSYIIDYICKFCLENVEIWKKFLSIIKRRKDFFLYIRVNMDPGRPLRYVTREDGGNAWPLKVSQDNYGYFGVKGTSLGKHCIVSKTLQSKKCSESADCRERRDGGKEFEIKSRSGRTLEIEKENGKSIHRLVKRSLENSYESIEDIERSRDCTKITGKFSGSKGGRSGGLQSAKQRAYLRLVLGRPSQKNTTKNDNFIDEDYVSLDDTLVLGYLREESEIEHTLRSGEAEQSSVGAELRSGVKSGKCRLSRKYGDVSVMQSDNSLVRYGK